MALYKELGCQQYYLAWQLHMLAKADAAQGDHTAARTRYEESLARAREVDDELSILSSLEGLAHVVALQGKSVWAARLWGAAEALREALGTSLPPVERVMYEHVVATARTQLGEKTFAKAWAEGRAMSPEQAFVAQGSVPMFTPTITGQSSTLPAKTTPTYPAGLTAREVEILRLVAQGKTDAQIAEQLVISPRTVNWHLTSIYSKLDVSSRTAATRYAIEHHVV